MSMGGRAEGLACTNPVARTLIGVSGNLLLSMFDSRMIRIIFINKYFILMFDSTLLPRLSILLVSAAQSWMMVCIPMLMEPFHNIYFQCPSIKWRHHVQALHAAPGCITGTVTPLWSNFHPVCSTSHPVCYNSTSSAVFQHPVLCLTIVCKVEHF